MRKDSLKNLSLKLQKNNNDKLDKKEGRQENDFSKGLFEMDIPDNYCGGCVD